MTRRVIAVGFGHMHIADQLRLAQAQPGVEVVGVYDDDSFPDRAPGVLSALAIDVPVSRDLGELLSDTTPDLALLCSSTADHPRYVATLAAAGVHTIVEKPMAMTADDSRAMIAAAEGNGVQLVVNWPLAWYPIYREAQRLVTLGAIGEIQQVHYYDGNQGPLRWVHDERERELVLADPNKSWWYDPDQGGGSLRDYLGYGTTLSTWFRGGEMPTSVTAAWHIPAGLRADEQAVVVGHYPTGLSVLETRWGTFTDPWTVQPQPRCGMVVNGSEGSMTAWDYDDAIELHDANGVRMILAATPAPEDRSALANLLAHLDGGRAIDEPITGRGSLRGQIFIDAAVESARLGKTVAVS